MDNLFSKFQTTLNIIAIFLYFFFLIKYGCDEKKCESVIYKYYIFSNTNDNRYIEYYPNIVLSSKNENLSIKYFPYVNYESFCICKKNYKLFNITLCLTSTECDSNFQILKDYYDIKYLSKWNNKTIYSSKKTYNFFQGYNNLTKKCDNIFDYKKCGHLIDLNIDFCIKESDPCPFTDTNISFYIKNLTKDIILLYENETINIKNKYNIKEFFPELIYKNKNNTNLYEIYQSTNLYKYINDNNIPFLKESINESFNQFKIELGLIKLNNSDIKTNINNYTERKFIKNGAATTNSSLYTLTFFFWNLITFSYASAIKISFGEIIYYKINHLILIFCSILFGVFTVIHYIFLYYENKSNLDKIYLFSDEYYYILKAIKNVIFDYTIILLTLIVVLVFPCTRMIKFKCNCLNRYRIAKIIIIILILCFLFLNFIN